MPKTESATCSFHRELYNADFSSGKKINCSAGINFG